MGAFVYAMQRALRLPTGQRCPCLWVIGWAVLFVSVLLFAPANFVA